MKKYRQQLTLFSIGAFGYGLIEILWRGFTHWSMLTAGGLCFCFFASISEKLKNKSIFLKGIIGSGLVTAVELLFGIIFNILLKQNIWDYSKKPFNLYGQICALYSFFWAILSIIFIPFANFVSTKIKNS